ncbi:MAG TPA: gephyrin-like molybdotransferase Glp [Terracidiphilus sp.]|nr:gephyrin-like molybdotransferase Glp [Terracidiphilus sp.]
MTGELLTYTQAAAFVAKHAERIARSKPATERVTLASAAGRVLAQTLRADTDQPPFARSTRDGFACRAAEASVHRPLAIAGASRAGDRPSGPLPPGAVWEIMTGAPVPRGADAVIMLEHIETAHAEAAGSSSAPTVRLLPPRTVEPGENIVARGAQARKGAALLPAGTLIGAAQIALAASCGCAELTVYAKPRVAILSTGDELVPIAAKPAPGQIRNSSSAMLAAMVAAAGGKPWILPIARDTAKSLDAALARVATADLLLITGGVSAGKFDLVEPALVRSGARFHFTGVRIQPGKPLVFAELRRRRTELAQDRTAADSNPKGRSMQWCFGLPGNPVSSAVTFQLFAAPILAALAGRSDLGPRFALARLAADVKTKPGLTRFLPAACTFTGPVPKVKLVAWQGSGDLAAMALANCYLVVPDDCDSLHAGATVNILLP